MSKPIVEIQHIDFSFPDPESKTRSFKDEVLGFIKRQKHPPLQIFSNFSLNLYGGDRIAILGKNGVGKSTLCRLVTGSYKPAKGKILVHGSVNAILQTNTGIEEELTGYENAFLLGKLLYSHLQNWKELIEEAIEFSELGDKIHWQFKNYSAGMRTRLGVAIQTIAPADLLILDEIFFGADAHFQNKMTKRMKNTIDQSKSIIMVTHNLELAKKLCNKCIIVDSNCHSPLYSIDEGIQEYLENYGD